jgi:hypothetical protein
MNKILNFAGMVIYYLAGACLGYALAWWMMKTGATTFFEQSMIESPDRALMARAAAKMVLAAPFGYGVWLVVLQLSRLERGK